MRPKMDLQVKLFAMMIVIMVPLVGVALLLTEASGIWFDVGIIAIFFFPMLMVCGILRSKEKVIIKK